MTRTEYCMRLAKDRGYFATDFARTAGEWGADVARNIHNRAWSPDTVEENARWAFSYAKTALALAPTPAMRLALLKEHNG